MAKKEEITPDMRRVFERVNRYRLLNELSWQGLARQMHLRDFQWPSLRRAVKMLTTPSAPLYQQVYDFHEKIKGERL